MTREQLEKQNIERDGFTFTPRYTYEEICLEDETIDFDYTITATAEEVYQEWLEQKKPKEPKKTLEEQLEDSNEKVQSLMEEQEKLKTERNTIAENLYNLTSIVESLLTGGSADDKATNVTND